MPTFAEARYGTDSYKDWLAAEGMLVVEGLAINCLEVETLDWPRVGARGAALHLDGRGDPATTDDRGEEERRAPDPGRGRSRR